MPTVRTMNEGGSRPARVSYPADGNARCFEHEDRSFWFGHRNDCILAAIRRFLPGGPILDVGGGNGFVTRRLLDEGFDAVLLEPGEVGAENARVHRKIPVIIRSTFEDAALSPGSQDAIGLFDVVEHVEDHEQFVARACSLLRPGGRLYVTVPAHGWLWSPSDANAGHFRRYDRAALVRLLHGNGFEVEYFTYFFRFLLLPVLLLRVLPFRLGLKQKLLPGDTEHASGDGPARQALGLLCAAERRAIAAGRALAGTGTSCLCVGRRAHERAAEDPDVSALCRQATPA